MIAITLINTRCSSASNSKVEDILLKIFFSPNIISRILKNYYCLQKEIERVEVKRNIYYFEAMVKLNNVKERFLFLSPTV